MVGSGGELAQAFVGAFAVESGGPTFSRFKRHPIMLCGKLWLAQLVETYGEVEQVIRIVGIAGNCIEIDLLCFVPARLFGVHIAEGKIELGGFRLGGKQGFQAAFGSRRVAAIVVAECCCLSAGSARC